jgi:SAM-dependent methyltransferase
MGNISLGIGARENATKDRKLGHCDASSMRFAPQVAIAPEPVIGRLRLLARWTRFFLKSVQRGFWDFAGHAIIAQAELARLTLADVVLRGQKVQCNICGWSGRRFYPNVGPGYNERDTLCPGCRSLDRHRALLAVLTHEMNFFAAGNRIVEVAPMRRLEQLYRAQPVIQYTSFDIERHAMEKGDITQMRFADDSVDFFLCFHVLEHIPDEPRALSEIHRVLHPGGIAVFQVPIEWSLEKSYEYTAPDPREVNHVRRYGRDFAQRVESAGFRVRPCRASDFAGELERARFGFSDEPIYFAQKA